MNDEAKGVEEIPTELCKSLKGILFDIDDTFTYEGKILPGAFAALWAARKEGLLLLPITGRPAGWADHIARMWPVDGVVGENGALYFRTDDEGRRLKRHFFVGDASLRARHRKKLEEIFQDVRKTYPAARLAADQPFRACDLAVDYREDTLPPMAIEEVREIQRIFEGHGAKAKISSIHLNAWFGEYDKLTMCRRYFRNEHGIDLQAEKERFLFCGDSPNDSPMFAFFPFSVGVAGIRRFHEAGLMDHMPRFLSDQDGGLGFEEAVRTVLGKRLR